MPRYDADTSAIRTELWPLVKEAMDKPATKTAYKRVVNEFISNRTEALYDSIPCDRILCSENEMDKVFDALKIKKSVFTDAIKKTYFGKIDHFRPLAAKHEFTIALILIIRYYLLENKDKKEKISKDCELALIHLAFSGKFYPSIHYGSYPTVTPVRHVMEYVVNNKLSNKFDLITCGSVVGAIRSVGTTWIETYMDRFEQLDDEDVVYLIQQLHSRIGSFTKNIAEEYYEAYDNKDLYMTYSSDSYDSDNFHLADSDMLKLDRAVEKTMNAINQNGVDYRICKNCQTSDITANECKAVMESILSSKENISDIRELIHLMISLYFATGEKDITDLKFITYSIASKPNAKQTEIVRMKEIIENWLCESGTAYMRRRSRVATRNAYERAVRMYFALIIHNANR